MRRIKTLTAIYKLMPQSVKDMCVASYKDISPRLEKSGECSFNYQGVRISKIVAGDAPVKVKFSYQGHHIIVNDYSKEVYDEIFGI
jgi:hypothetical protein